VTAQATLQDYKLQLKQLLELDGESEMNLYIPTLGTENVLAPLPTKTDVYRSALVLRPEIEAGKLNIQTSDLDIKIARAGYLPTLSLSAGIGTSHANGNDFTFSEQVKQNWNNSLGFTVSVPIFSNRQTKSAVEKAKIQKQTSELDLLDDQKTLYKTIETLWLDANSAQQRYAAATEKLKSTQTSYELIQEQFNLGMKNTVELLTEKSNLLSAQQETLQAKYMAILNMQLLKFYQGEKIEL
jgi:outer membrane protein